MNLLGPVSDSIEERAECAELNTALRQLGPHLDKFLEFEHGDAYERAAQWQAALGGELPQQGIGLRALIQLIGTQLVPNGSALTKPGCTSWITTGATTAGIVASLSASVASPQRFGLTAFNFLEDLSLNWMANLFGLPEHMQGVYTSGGSVANLIALGAARQEAFEAIGVDPAQDGLSQPCVLFASEASHHTINRAAAVLGMGRSAVQTIAIDSSGRMDVTALEHSIIESVAANQLPIAIVANAGTTSAGVIDPISSMAELAQRYGIWLHIDGAYGLPGVLDSRVTHLYEGLRAADSVIVDPHKWLGAPVGIGAAYVRNAELLQRAFTQEPADYFERSFNPGTAQSSLDRLGTPYSEFGVELSAPARGVTVWALIKEIGQAGLRERVERHNTMARDLAEQVTAHPQLELLLPPTLSICCFRFNDERCGELNEANRLIHRRLVMSGENIPSTTRIGGVLALRPCFLGARTGLEQVSNLVAEVLEVGNSLIKEHDNV